MSAFSGAHVVSSYAANAARMVPGLHDLPKMAGVLLAERASDHARILVLGAGGGLELKALAEMKPDWSLHGVDPSADMLQLAREHLGPLASAVRLHQGYIDTAPEGPFDGATCLLTLHFLPKAERLRTLKQIHQRLKAGAPLVVVHHSFPGDGPEQRKWLRRNASFAAASGLPEEQAEKILALKGRLPVLSPSEDAELLRESGFVDVELFYAAFTFKGWVARNGGHGTHVDARAASPP